MMVSLQDSVKIIRNSAPYINAHRGKTFVIVFGGEAIEEANFANIIHDIALLSSLGVRLVLVHGARPQIDSRVAMRGLAGRYHDGVRITDKATLECVKDAAGSVRSQIEALLTMGLANSPMHGAHIRVCSGNLVVAMPIGVRDGVDFEHSGQVRRIDVDGIRDHLNDGSIVLLSMMGYSSTGEVFNLVHQEVAMHTAISLKADKLICFTSASGLVDEQGTMLPQLEYSELESLIAQETPNDPFTLRAIQQSLLAGIPRCHCVSYRQDGALLQELFTRDGSGTLIASHHYEQVRRATIEDVGGILNLIDPLEQKGILVKRSRELLEAEIGQFTVIDRDGMIVACAALYPYIEERCGEVACVATHSDYRGGARGERLMRAMKKQALKLGLERIFVLTTVTAHWFMEQGFTLSSPDSLPEKKKRLYNYQRNSKVFELALTTTEQKMRE